MANTNETIADIIAEMRGMGNYQRYSGDHARVLAGRIEAAHKRERGDAAKLREALENLYDQICHGETEQHVAANRQMIRAALSAPPRNCEVGTPEEQAERLHAYCKSHRCLYCSSGNGDECKFYRPGMKTDCKIEWANAPYKEGGAK